MDATTAAATSPNVVGVDLAKSAFRLAAANASWRVVEQHRLTRSQCERRFVNRSTGLVVMKDSVVVRFDAQEAFFGQRAASVAHERAPDGCLQAASRIPINTINSL